MRFGAKLCDNELIPQPWVSQSNHKNWQTKSAATNYFFVFSAVSYCIPKLKKALPKAFTQRILLLSLENPKCPQITNFQPKTVFVLPYLAKSLS